MKISESGIPGQGLNSTKSGSDFSPGQSSSVGVPSVSNIRASCFRSVSPGRNGF